MRRRWAAAAIRAAFLFLLSVLLVAGFWFHSEFYQFGLTNLLLLGGFITFLVIMGARLALSGELPRGRPTAELTFTAEEGDRILRDIATAVVRPADADSLPVVGQIVRARYDTGPEFGRLQILDARRSYASDLTDADARLAGYRTARELLDSARPRLPTGSWDLVTILRIERLRAGR